MTALPGDVDDILDLCKCLLFYFLDHKEAATIQKQVAGKDATRMTGAVQRFYMDFGLLKVLASDYV